MSGSNGLEKPILGNRHDEQLNSTIKDWQGQSFTPATGAQRGMYLNPLEAAKQPNPFSPQAYPGNIVSTTQVPSTNPNPTNLTGAQFVNTLYLDAGSTNTINAPSLQDVLKYVQQYQPTSLSDPFELTTWVVNRDPQFGKTIAMTDPAWNRTTVALSFFPNSLTKNVFVITGTSNPATATVMNANTSSGNGTLPLDIVNTTGGIVNPTVQITDINTNPAAGPLPAGTFWEMFNIDENSAAWGAAPRATAGDRDKILRLFVSTNTPVNGIAAFPIGFTGGGYFLACIDDFIINGAINPNGNQFYVKVDGRMMARLYPNAAYTNAVLFDPNTQEFGQAVSSQRYKKEIADATEDDLAFMDNVRPRTFQFKDEEHAGKTFVGVIAEELERVVPDHLKHYILTYSQPTKPSGKKIKVSRPTQEEPGRMVEIDEHIPDGPPIIEGINDHGLVASLLANQGRLMDYIKELKDRVSSLEALPVQAAAAAKKA